jgi:hypothetical protein
VRTYDLPRIWVPRGRELVAGVRAVPSRALNCGATGCLQSELFAGVHDPQTRASPRNSQNASSSARTHLAQLATSTPRASSSSTAPIVRSASSNKRRAAGRCEALALWFEVGVEPDAIGLGREGVRLFFVDEALHHHLITAARVAFELRVHEPA